MKEMIVDIADFKVTNNPDVELVTYSLGSCIGIAIWDPNARVGGMLHFMLPDSVVCRDRAVIKPGMFADTGIPLLFRSAYRLGAVKPRLVVKVAGGAAMFNTNEAMNIGKHNYVAMRKIFWRNNVLIDSEHTGDSISRTMRLHVGTGEVTIGNQKLGRVAI